MSILSKRITLLILIKKKKYYFTIPCSKQYEWNVKLTRCWLDKVSLCLVSFLQLGQVVLQQVNHAPNFYQ